MNNKIMNKNNKNNFERQKMYQSPVYQKRVKRLIESTKNYTLHCHKKSPTIDQINAAKYFAEPFEVESRRANRNEKIKDSSFEEITANPQKL